MAVLALDLRGHGDSVEKKGHCAPRREVLEDVSSLLEYAAEKYPGRKIVLYGHSMGGNITLDYRARGRLNHMPCGIPDIGSVDKACETDTGGSLCIGEDIGKNRTADDHKLLCG